MSILWGLALRVTCWWPMAKFQLWVCIFSKSCLFLALNYISHIYYCYSCVKRLLWNNLPSKLKNWILCAILILSPCKKLWYAYSFYFFYPLEWYISKTVLCFPRFWLLIILPLNQKKRFGETNCMYSHLVCTLIWLDCSNNKKIQFTKTLELCQ